MRNRSSVVLISLCVALLSSAMLPSIAQAQDLKGAVEQLARDLGNSVPEGKMLIVAIADFPDLQGAVSDLGRYVAERLVTRLSARPEKFRVIERRRLDQVLTELRFSLTDLVNPAKAEQLGKMLGVQAIVVGTLSDLGNNVDIDARIIEIGTNSTLPGVSVTLSKDDTVRQLLERGRQLPLYGGVATSGNLPTSPPRGPSAGFYESPELRIEVESLKVLKNYRILLTLRYINRRPTPLGIALNDGGHSSYSSFPTFFIDELGNRHDLYDTSIVSNKPLVLAPGASETATLTFGYNSTPGEDLSLATDMDFFEVDENGQARRDGKGNPKPFKTLNIWIRNLAASKR